MSKTTKPKKKSAMSKPSGLKRFAYWGAVAGVWGVIALTGLLALVAWDMPKVDTAIAAIKKPTIRVFSSDGVLLARSGDVYAQPIKSIRDLSPQLPHAILATEDRRFFDHIGIDFISIARAALVNLKAGGIRQGGSTITQQAAKNLFLSSERTLKRKIQETLLAFWLEAKFSKDQIFTIYLNRVYFGSGVYGVAAAAQHYFGEDAKNLGAFEAAMLAGMLKGPNKYNPISNPDLAEARAKQVLANMVAAGYMTKVDADQAVKRKTWKRVAGNKSMVPGRHFANWVLTLVPDFVTLDRDVIVTTTLNTRLQKFAESAFRRWMKAGGTAEARNVGEAALVAMDPSGALLAMVGGKDLKRSGFNRAVQAQRQPGSAFKPVVYLAGLEAGLRPQSILADEPLTIDGWSPKNFKREFIGNVTIRDALVRSINTVAVKVSERAGRKNVKDAARRLGFSGDLVLSPALALGVSETTLVELTASYAVFANGGFGVWPYAISQIKDQAGTVLYARTGSGPGRMVAPKDVKDMRSMLTSVIASDNGTGKKARLKGRLAAGKTGTSQDYRDAWFIGFTPDLVAGVWMGNDNATPMKGVTGGTLPASLWKDFMSVAAKKSSASNWPDIPARPTGPSDARDTATPVKKSTGPNIFEQLFESIFGK